jgi:hypothetical protein
MRCGAYKTRRGLHNPKRGKCPSCGKRGLGKQKTIEPFGVFRECRYCHKLEDAQSGNFG